MALSIVLVAMTVGSRGGLLGCPSLSEKSHHFRIIVAIVMYVIPAVDCIQIKIMSSDRERYVIITFHDHGPYSHSFAAVDHVLQLSPSAASHPSSQCNLFQALL
jgi:hypothetical protein